MWWGSTCVTLGDRQTQISNSISILILASALGLISSSSLFSWSQSQVSVQLKDQSVSHLGEVRKLSRNLVMEIASPRSPDSRSTSASRSTSIPSIPSTSGALSSALPIMVFWRSFRLLIYLGKTSLSSLALRFGHQSCQVYLCSQDVSNC